MHVVYTVHVFLELRLVHVHVHVMTQSLAINALYCKQDMLPSTLSNATQRNVI